jgi:hypothetical protein
MAATYYAVCNVNGPISVRLDGETEEEALAAFAKLDGRAAVDGARTDAEDDLEIEAAGEFDESDFGAALEAAGAKPVRDLAGILSGQGATERVAHVSGGWYLWCVEATSYTYSIFDSDPAASGNAWDAHDSVEIEAESDEDALAQVRDILEIEAAGLSTADGYAVGQRLYATVWGPDETIVGQPTHELTAEDLGVDESDAAE